MFSIVIETLFSHSLVIQRQVGHPQVAVGMVTGDVVVLRRIPHEAFVDPFLKAKKRIIVPTPNSLTTTVQITHRRIAIKRQTYCQSNRITLHKSVDKSINCHLLKSNVKVSGYLAQYSVIRIAQSALLFTPADKRTPS